MHKRGLLASIVLGLSLLLGMSPAKAAPMDATAPTGCSSPNVSIVPIGGGVGPRILGFAVSVLTDCTFQGDVEFSAVSAAGHRVWHEVFRHQTVQSTGENAELNVFTGEWYVKPNTPDGDYTILVTVSSATGNTAYAQLNLGPINVPNNVPVP